VAPAPAVAAADAPALEPLCGYDAALVGVKPTRAAEAIVRAAGGEAIVRRLGIWRVSTSRARTVLPVLQRAKLLRYVEPDRPQPKAGHLDTGDPLATPEIGWHLYRVGADRAEPPGPGVPVTIIDSGLDTTHLEFRNRPNTVLLNPQPARSWEAATLYHGTSVSEVAAAPSDGVGAIGVYPQAVLREWAVEAVFDAPLTGDIVHGIDRAASVGRTVINLSLSGPSFSRTEYEAIIAAARRGALVVAAAGNDFKQGSPVEYPASLPHVFTVASTGTTDAPSPFSNRSSAIDLAAPGESIPVQHPTDPTVWRTVSGTSFSAPIVAAAAAWVWTVRPELDATQLEGVLRASARDVWTTGFDDRTGYGLLDIPAALAAPAGPPDVQEPNDDIDQIAPGRLFATGRAPLTTLAKRTARFTASLDENEDPSDVYRLVVPGGRTLKVTVTGSTNLGAMLWSARARSVFADGKAAQPTQLAASNRPGKRAERLVYRNRARGAVTVYLDVWPARDAARTATYTATISTR
jgi:subtilisin family serine protease